MTTNKNYKHFTISDAGQGISVITFFRKDIDANALSESVITEFNDIFSQLNELNDVKGIIITSGRPNQFIAGADIAQIESFKTAAETSEGSRQANAVFSGVANAKKPVVAAIHGACLGGGLELALACKWRVATDDPATILGLPEIQLGIIPGIGGTQRLPRLVGLQVGLDLILTGKRIKADKALKMGLVDAVVHRNQLMEIALSFAQKKNRIARKKSFAEIALEGNPFGRGIMQKKAKETVLKTTKGFYPAPLRALEVVFKGFDRSLEKGLELESQVFGELAMTRESSSLIHLFHATTAIKKHKYKSAGEERFGDSQTKLVGVIGAGFMGSGIATVCLDKKIRVRMSDPSKEALAKSLGHVRDFFKKKLKRRQLKSFEAEQRLAMYSPGTSPTGFQSCDIVIEAVFEDLKLKQKLLNQTEQGAHKDWIFASNTSALPIAKIAEATKQPERVLGMHFFSPVEKMPLLEIVVTDKTAPWATARAIELGQTIGKQVIVVQDGPGFYTTRALAFYLVEGAMMVAEGARIEKLDKAMNDFGFPVGPITLIDEIGIDVCQHVVETIHGAFPDRTDQVMVPETIKLILGSKRLGRKNNKGFYLYHDGKKNGPDPEIYKMLAKYKISPKGIPSDEIVDRCLLVFVNESVRCLEERILASAYDGDVGAVFGLGFPPFWGGPFRYVDHIGARVLVERLRVLETRYGPRFKPAKLLLQHAETDKKFFPDERQKA